MVMNKVQSSAIEAVGFEPRTGVFRVKFTSGVTYEYLHFSLLEFAEFMNAPSKGTHFHNQIKPYYTGYPLSL